MDIDNAYNKMSTDVEAIALRRLKHKELLENLHKVPNYMPSATKASEIMRDYRKINEEKKQHGKFVKEIEAVKEKKKRMKVFGLPEAFSKVYLLN